MSRKLLPHLAFKLRVRKPLRRRRQGTLPRRGHGARGIFRVERRWRVLPYPFVHSQRGARFFANLISALRQLSRDGKVASMVDYAILNSRREPKAQIGMAQQRLERALRAVRPRLERVDDPPALGRHPVLAADVLGCVPVLLRLHPERQQRRYVESGEIVSHSDCV